MKIINNIKDKFSYHFIVGAVAASLLCSGGSYGAEITDAELEKRIAERYHAFRGLTLTGAAQPICRALQFVRSLADNDEPESERMIAMILRDGRGVGGIDTNRSANESETGVYYSLIARAKTKGVSKDVFHPITPDTTTVLGRHQLALAIAYDVILVPAATTGSVQPFVNYVTDLGAYTTLNRLCQATWALRLSDCSVLAREIPESVQVKLTNPNLMLSESVKANLLSHALTLPIDEREGFVLETANLLPKSYAETAREKVTKVLLTLPVGHWLRYMKQTEELYSISFDSTLKQLSYLRDLNMISDNEIELYTKHKPLKYCLDQLEILENLRNIPDHEQSECIQKTKNLSPALQHIELITNLAAARIKVKDPSEEEEVLLAKLLVKKLAAEGIMVELPLLARGYVLENVLITKLAAARIMVEAPSGEGEVLVDQLLELDPSRDLIAIFGKMTDHTTRQSIFVYTDPHCLDH